MRFGPVLLEHVALAIRDAHDGVRAHPHALVRERAVRAGHVPQRLFNRAKREREIRRHVWRQAEPRGDLDDIGGAELGERLDGRDVARVFERPAHRHGPFVLLVVVERLIRRLVRAGDQRDRLIDEDRHRRVSTIDCRRIDERLERRPDLALRLGRPIELAPREAEAANHRAHLSGPIVDCEKCPFDQRVLFECDRLRYAALHRPHFDLNEVTDAEEINRRGLPRPRECAFRQLDFVSAYPHASAAISPFGRDRHHERWYDVALEDRPVPPIGRERIQRALFGDDVSRRLPVAAVTLVEASQSAIERPIGSLLQFGVESRLHAQP